jgi:hypothetical protein
VRQARNSESESDQKELKLSTGIITIGSSYFLSLGFPVDCPAKHPPETPLFLWSMMWIKMRKNIRENNAGNGGKILV